MTVLLAFESEASRVNIDATGLATSAEPGGDATVEHSLNSTTWTVIPGGAAVAYVGQRFVAPVYHTGYTLDVENFYRVTSALGDAQQASITPVIVPEPVPAPVAPVLCSAWATPADVPAQYRGQTTDEHWEVLLMVASEILWALSGRRWYGQGCTETAVYRGACCCCGQRVAHGNGDTYWWVPPEGVRIWRDHCGSRALQLPRQRITPGSVTMTIAGEPFDAIRVDHTPGMLYRLDNCPWFDCGDADISVSYGYGSPPPLAGKRAAVLYAIQLWLAENGDEACELPDRVQTVTRQGISYVMFDPADFIENQRTGVVRGVDSWLAAVNPYGRAQEASVWSPDVPVLRR